MRQILDWALKHQCTAQALEGGINLAHRLKREAFSGVEVARLCIGFDDAESEHRSALRADPLVKRMEATAPLTTAAHAL